MKKKRNYSAYSYFDPSLRYYRTRMVTYDLYAHILRATMPCSGTKPKHAEQL